MRPRLFTRAPSRAHPQVLRGSLIYKGASTVGQWIGPTTYEPFRLMISSGCNAPPTPFGADFQGLCGTSELAQKAQDGPKRTSDGSQVISEMARLRHLANHIKQRQREFKTKKTPIGVYLRYHKVYRPNRFNRPHRPNRPNRPK